MTTIAAFFIGLAPAFAYFTVPLIRVVGVDISDSGLAKGRSRAQAEGVDVDFRRVDLDEGMVAGMFDLILNFNFLLRELIPSEVASLKPGGLLLFDTIMSSEQLLQPHNPAYLLQPGELKRIFAPFDGETFFSEESSDNGFPTARLLFRKRPIVS